VSQACCKGAVLGKEEITVTMRETLALGVGTAAPSTGHHSKECELDHGVLMIQKHHILEMQSMIGYLTVHCSW
jgi:hypothetical protein